MNTIIINTCIVFKMGIHLIKVDNKLKNRLILSVKLKASRFLWYRNGFRHPLSWCCHNFMFQKNM